MGTDPTSTCNCRNVRCHKLPALQRLELGKQALATDRQLSGVKRKTRDFAGKKALKYWRGACSKRCWEKKRWTGAIMWGGIRYIGGGTRLLSLYVFHPLTLIPFLARWNSNSKESQTPGLLALDENLLFLEYIHVQLQNKTGFCEYMQDDKDRVGWQLAATTML